VKPTNNSLRLGGPSTRLRPGLASAWCGFFGSNALILLISSARVAERHRISSERAARLPAPTPHAMFADKNKINGPSPDGLGQTRQSGVRWGEGNTWHLSVF